MEQIVSQPTLTSPKKTGALIVGVSALVVGAALIIKYLVNKSAPKSTFDGTPLTPEANWDFNVGVPSSSEPPVIGPEMPEEYRIADNVGCGDYYKFNIDVDEFNPDNNERKCGEGVYEFQEMLYEIGHLSDINDVDGKYGPKTKEAHEKWLAASSNNN